MRETRGTHSSGCSAGQDLVAGHHAGEHVVGDVAVIEPDSGIVGHHVGGDHLGGCDVQHISPLAAHQHGVAMPVRRVSVKEVAKSGDVPAHVIANFHGHHGPVAVDVS